MRVPSIAPLGEERCRPSSALARAPLPGGSIQELSVGHFFVDKVPPICCTGHNDVVASFERESARVPGQI